MSSTEGLAERLASLGLTQKEFAAALGVGKSAVSNWLERGDMPARAEACLAGLEGKASGRIGLGVLVEVEGRYGRVVRRDRCEVLFGSKPVQWVYYVSDARKGKDGWTHEGPARRYPEGYLKELDEVEWAAPEVRGKP